MDSASNGRLPDFVIIGTMKSGTTTLYRWLDEHPQIQLPRAKEPNFFADDRIWRHGVGWYERLFAEIGPDLRTGEASVVYTDPRNASMAAKRLKSVVPYARLICVLRHPVERLRSHYRHEVQRGRERRPLTLAVSTPDNAYVARSRYASGLEPWVDHFGRDQLHVVRFEDLVGDGGRAWRSVLSHLGVDALPRPDGAYNVTAEKAQFTRPMRMLWERGLIPDTRRLPVPVRRAARRVLLRSSDRYSELLAASHDELPDALLGSLRTDIERLPELLSNERLCW